MKEGTELDVLSPLGNGFDISALGDEATKATMPAIVGGGIGVPPLYGLAKAMTEKGLRPDVILGFNKSDEIIMEEDFRRLGIEPVITTVDGSVGIKGFVTDAMKDRDYDYAFACCKTVSFNNNRSSLLFDISAGFFGIVENFVCGGRNVMAL